jgi:hypothetical protein
LRSKKRKTHKFHAQTSEMEIDFPEPESPKPEVRSTGGCQTWAERIEEQK